jgi:hypothetical protein
VVAGEFTAQAVVLFVEFLCEVSGIGEAGDSLHITRCRLCKEPRLRILLQGAQLDRIDLSGPIWSMTMRARAANGPGARLRPKRRSVLLGDKSPANSYR